MKAHIFGTTVGLLLLSFVSVAHADAVHEPHTGTIDIWASIVSAVEYVAQEAAAAALAVSNSLQHVAAATSYQRTEDHDTNSLAAAAVQSVYPTSDVSAQNSSTTNPATAETGSPEASNAAPMIEKIIEFEPLATNNFVTQSQLATQLQQLSDTLVAKLSPATSSPIPQNVAADGNPDVPYAGTNNITNLSNVTISNANLTASEIPALNYFPSTSTISIAYGGTGISSAPGYGQLLLGDGSGGYSLVATSSLGIVGGGGSSASSTLLADSNTFFGNNLFTASTTFSKLVNIANASTSLATFGSVWLPSITNALLYGNGSGQIASAIVSYPLQFSGGALSLAFGTTTSNTWAGTQTFTNTPIVGSLSGLIGASNGNLYQIATSTNLVTSLAAGSGIAVSGSTGNLTITNTIGYPFANNATSTTLTFSSGLLSLASTTIGNGSQNGGLTISGGATTTGDSLIQGNATTTGNFATKKLLIYDNFQRANTSGGNLGNAVTGQTWSVTGAGAAGAQIYNDGFTSSDGVANAYIWGGYSTTTLHMSISFAWTVATTSGFAIMSSADDPFSANHILHLVIGTTGADLTWWLNGSDSNQISCQTAEGQQDGMVFPTPLLQNGTVYTVQMDIDIPQNTVILTDPFGNQATCYDPHVSEVAGGTGIWENTGYQAGALMIYGAEMSLGTTIESYGSILSTNGINGPIGTLYPSSIFANSFSVGTTTDATNTPLGVGVIENDQTDSRYRDNGLVITSSGYGASLRLTAPSIGYSPVIYFDEGYGDAATPYIYSYAGGLDLRVNVAGTDRLVFPYNNAEAGAYFQNGNVGIGTTTPWAQLSINPNGISGPAFAIGSSTATDFIVTSGGSVGIGTTSASLPLTVSGNVNNDGIVNLINTNTAGASGIDFRDASDNLAAVFGYTNASDSIAPGKLYFGTLNKDIAFSTSLNSTYNLLISGSTGNVGIGTSAPIDELQIAGLSNPVEASSTTSGLSHPASVYISGRYAYVASEGNSSLVIFDISNPASPVKVGSTTSGLGFPDAVYVSGRYAYVTDFSNGLVIFDISNPASPVKVGSTTSGLSTPSVVYVSGRYAYVTTSTALVIFDISNPASPVEVGSTTSGLNDPVSVYISGRYAYVASEGNSSLVIFDISNPASPVEVGSSTNGLSQPSFVYIQGRYAYVDDFNNGFIVFDISNPTSPIKVSSTTSGLSSPDSVNVSGRYAYVASGSTSSLVVFDISNPASPVEVGSTTSGLSDPFSIYVSGRYAYIASFTNNALVTFQVGGEYTQSLEAGTLQAGSLELDNNLQALDGAFSGGLTVGNNLNVGGSFSLTASTYNATTSNTQNYSIFSINAASSTNPLVNVLYNGNVGIGTSTPYTRLSVWGSDSASSTLAFNVVNSASTTDFAVFDGGNAQLAGTLSQNSDQRLKTDIQSLSASSSLSFIDELNPVTFNWIDPNRGTQPQLGFIAQQVLPIFPNLVSTTSPTVLTPDGTLSLNYIGLISPIVSAIQGLSAGITSIEITIAEFADSFTTQQLTFTRELCAEESSGAHVCITGDQLAAIAAQAGEGSGGSSQSGSNPSGDATDTPPEIQVNGANPAVIQVGATYSDLGATITGPQADLNLGIQTYIDGTPMNPVQIDTSQAATDTIDYVVTDQNGLISTSTRTVIIEAPSIVPSDDAASTTPQAGAATTTDATTTAQ